MFYGLLLQAIASGEVEKKKTKAWILSKDDETRGEIDQQKMINDSARRMAAATVKVAARNIPAVKKAVKTLGIDMVIESPTRLNDMVRTVYHGVKKFGSAFKPAKTFIAGLF